MIFPKTYLAYDLSVYIPRISDRYLTIDYLETPENFAGYNPIYSSETKSEFHPQNINNFPENNNLSLPIKEIFDKTFMNLSLIS